MYVSDSEAWVLASLIGKLGPSQDAKPKAPRSAEAVTRALPGFLGKVRVETSFGLLPIEALRVNDPIVTTTGRKLLVRRVNRMGLDRDFLDRHPNAQPFQIAANAIAHGVPGRDILVSPGQELTVEVRDSAPRRMTPGDIAGNCAVVRAPQATLTYFSFELSEAAHVCIEGVSVLIPAYKGARQDVDDAEE